jgi:hypothetical protein
MAHAKNGFFVRLNVSDAMLVILSTAVPTRNEPVVASFYRRRRMETV